MKRVTAESRKFRQHRVGLADVARAAGVHISTVSRVLNDVPIAISAETRERVQAAATELHYRPQAAGRMLRMASAGALGMLVPSLRNPVWATIVHGAISKGTERGYVILVAEDTGDDARQVAYERLVSEGRIDGLVICSAPVSDSMLDRIDEDAVPVVFANRGVPGSNRNVVMDEQAAARMAVEHLAGLGHTRIAQIDGPLTIDTAARRLQGFEQACVEFGVDGRALHVDFTEAAAYRAVCSVMKGRRVPTAWIVSNLNQLLGALGAVHELGIDVPEGLALISYDEDPMLDWLAVTSIAMPLDHLGAAGVDVLVEQLGGAPPQDVVISEPARLVVRRSTSGEERAGRGATPAVGR
jgi:LacI family transcriptional regulator